MRICIDSRVLSLTKTARLAVTITSFATSSLFAQESPSVNNVRQVLQGPLTIGLESGQSQTGMVSDWDGTTLKLRVSLGGGAAEMTFPASEIQGIRFPGSKYKQLLPDWKDSPERVEDVFELYRAFYQQQGPYLSLLSQRDLGIFIDYADFALLNNKPLRAVAIIDLIKPFIEDESIRVQLEENLLLAFFDGGMKEEAEEEARKWIQKAKPAGNSALGWRLLAELHFQNEDFERAFWTAMHPVAFSNQMPMAHLDVCYALAILSAEELRLKEEPQRLAVEMQKRGMKWPDYVAALSGKAPEFFHLEISEPEELQVTENAEKELEIHELEPLQTPSPVDPVESLPTRIYN
ncbi:MAG: hypothetical protein AAF065_00960 [Verrucomicrobiota bacterium]